MNKNKKVASKWLTKKPNGLIYLECDFIVDELYGFEEGDICPECNEGILVKGT